MSGLIFQRIRTPTSGWEVLRSSPGGRGSGAARSSSSRTSRGRRASRTPTVTMPAAASTCEPRTTLTSPMASAQAAPPTDSSVKLITISE